MKKLFTLILLMHLLSSPTTTADLPCTFPSQHFVIVAHGSGIDEALLRHECATSTVVALDGASSYLDEKGIQYHVLLGDFDSVDPEKVAATFDAITDTSLPYEHKGHLIVPHKNQDLTDLCKGILFCDHHGATSITLFGATGDREDHSELNRNALKKYYKADRPLIMRCAQQTMAYVTQDDSPYRFTGVIGDKCGLFAYPETVHITTHGLRWDITNGPLVFAEASSACNELVGEEVTISIIDGPGVLVIQPNPRVG